MEAIEKFINIDELGHEIDGMNDFMSNQSMIIPLHNVIFPMQA